MIPPAIRRLAILASLVVTNLTSAGFLVREHLQKGDLEKTLAQVLPAAQLAQTSVCVSVLRDQTTLLKGQVQACAEVAQRCQGQLQQAGGQLQQCLGTLEAAGR